MNQTIRFIHAADLHLGSVMKNLEAYHGAPVDRMRHAPLDAFENLVRLAIDSEVAAVLIAGDVFDGPWRDAGIGLWLAEQFRKMAEKNIEVLTIRGNHDAQSIVRQTVQWPENVREFSCDESQTIQLSCGMAVHGRSFADFRVVDDLAADYPKADPNSFNVGLLHTSLGGSSLHDTYAPTDIRTLLKHGYQYWALGHIHLRSQESLGDPSTWIGYSGNIQGRSVREVGPRGCYLVTVEDGQLRSVEFRETDVARWEILEVDISELTNIVDINCLVECKLAELVARSGNRIVAVRIVLVGTTNLNNHLHKITTHPELVGQFRNIANSLGNVWIEKVKIKTTAIRNIQHIQQHNQVTAAILEQAVQLRREAAHDEDLKAIFATVQKKCKEHFGIAIEEYGDDALWKIKVNDWIEDATHHLISEVLGDEIPQGGLR